MFFIKVVQFNLEFDDRSKVKMFCWVGTPFLFCFPWVSKLLIITLQLITVYKIDKINYYFRRWIYYRFCERVSNILFSWKTPDSRQIWNDQIPRECYFDIVDPRSTANLRNTNDVQNVLHWLHEIHDFILKIN